MSRDDSTCTERERWPSPPRSDAPDEEITSYLEHLENCPYHASLEREETEAVQRDYQLARSIAKDDLPLSPESKTEVLDNFERYLDFREGGETVKEVLLR